MNADPAPRSRAVVLPLLLLLASLAALYAGRFIQFDDTSGYGSERWVMPLGALAGLLALGAVGVGLTHRPARRAVGGALVVLDVLLVAQAVTNDGFRFIWSVDEEELFYLQVALGFAGLLLLTPRLLSTRVAVYVSALTVGMLVAFSLGAAHFESTRCSGPELSGECDLAGLEGIWWAAGALVLGIVAIVVAEAVRSRKRRAGRRLEQPIGA